MVCRLASTLSEPHALCPSTRDCELSRSKKNKELFLSPPQYHNELDEFIISYSSQAVC